MSIPTLTELAAVAVNATLDDAGAWNRRTSAEQDRVKARVRYGLDYLATVHGIRPEDIYAAGPSDPPPVEPAS